MGWLTNIFKSNETKLYESTLLKERGEYKQSKERITELEMELKNCNTEILRLKELNLSLTYELKYNDNINNLVNFSPKIKKKVNPELVEKEREVLERTKQVKNFKELLKVCGMTEGSLRVYLSRLRQKHYTISWKQD